MQHDLLWAFVIIFAVDSIAPGPAVAMVIARGASVGLLRTLPFIAGLVLGDLLLFVMALSGLVVLAKSFAPLFFVLKWVGVCYLLYLAYSTWVTKPMLADAQPIGGFGIRSFALALILPLGNPKAVGFYVALLPAFMDIQTLTLVTAVKFSLAIVLIWGLVLVGYTFLADRGRQHLKHNPMALNWLNKGAAAAMVGAAGTVAMRP